MESGETFIKLAWNPIYLEPATPFRDEMPTWGVEIVCDGDCNGLPCAIDPSKHQVNEIDGSNTDGAGGANFCVVTVPKGATANFVVFEGGMSDSDSGSGGAPQSVAQVSGSSSAPEPTSSSTLSPSPTPTPTPTPEPTPTPKPTPTPTTAQSSSAVLTSTFYSSSSILPPSSSTYSFPSSSSSVLAVPSIAASSPQWSPLSAASHAGPSISEAAVTSVHSHHHIAPSYSAAALSFHYKPHVFVQNGTSTVASPSSSSLPTNTTGSPSEPLPFQTVKPTGAGYNVQVTTAGLALTALAAVAIVAL